MIKRLICIINHIVRGSTLKYPKTDFAIGDNVIVYDRFRFAIPLKCRVMQIHKGGIRVKLKESNNAHYPIGADAVWVFSTQLRICT